MADQGARLDHVGLAVADLAAQAAWFCEVFELVPELALRVEALDLSIWMLIHPRHGYRLELLHRPGSAAGGKPGTPGEAALRDGYGHVAFDRHPRALHRGRQEDHVVDRDLVAPVGHRLTGPQQVKCVQALV